MIQEMRDRQAATSAQRKKQRAWNRERVQYGTTASGDYVDPELLDQLQGVVGCARAVTAEALRQTGNSFDAVRCAELRCAMS